jgi:hypothetical protein
VAETFSITNRRAVLEQPLLIGLCFYANFFARPRERHTCLYTTRYIVTAVHCQQIVATIKRLVSSKNDSYLKYSCFSLD